MVQSLETGGPSKMEETHLSDRGEGPDANWSMPNSEGGLWWVLIRIKNIVAVSLIDRISTTLQFIHIATISRPAILFP